MEIKDKCIIAIPTSVWQLMTVSEFHVQIGFIKLNHKLKVTTEQNIASPLIEPLWIQIN